MALHDARRDARFAPLLLTVTGRKSGESRTNPLIYAAHGDAYTVGASVGGADAPPAWYLERR